MIQVAAYCRVSTDKEDQANSFETQQRYFREWIDRNPEWMLQEIYADEGISGTNTKKRTQFNRMIRAAREGKIDLIITKEVSRFARNTVDTLEYTRELRKRGIGVLFHQHHGRGRRAAVDHHVLHCPKREPHDLRPGKMGAEALYGTRRSVRRLAFGLRCRGW